MAEEKRRSGLGRGIGSLIPSGEREAVDVFFSSENEGLTAVPEPSSHTLTQVALPRTRSSREQTLNQRLLQSWSTQFVSLGCCSRSLLGPRAQTSS